MKSIRVFLSERFRFLEVKFTIHLNRRVFWTYVSGRTSEDTFSHVAAQFYTIRLIPTRKETSFNITILDIQL